MNRKLAGAGLIAAAVFAAGWYGWRCLSPVAEPPAVELSAVERESAQSIEAARAAVRAQPRSAETWGRLGMLFFANEFYPEAVVCCAHAEQLDGSDVRWPYYQGLSVSKRNPADAAPLFRRAAARTDRDWVPHLRLAETCLQVDAFAEATAEFQSVLKQDAANPHALLGLGLTLLQKGSASSEPAAQARDLRASLPLLTAAAASPFTQKSARIALAQAYVRLGEKEKAQAAAREAAVLPEDPPWPDPYREKALDLLTGPQARCFYASTLLDQGRLRKALTIAEEVARQHPESDQAYVIIGEVHKRQGRSAEAEKPLREALRLKPDSYWTNYLLGSVRFDQNDFTEAAELFRCAGRLKPGDAAAYDNLGVCQLRLGDKTGAVETWHAGLGFQPNAVAIHYHLGDFLAQEGKREKALEHLRQAQRLEPNNEKVRTRLAEVEALHDKR